MSDKHIHTNTFILQLPLEVIPRNRPPSEVKLQKVRRIIRVYVYDEATLLRQKFVSHASEGSIGLFPRNSFRH